MVAVAYSNVIKEPVMREVSWFKGRLGHLGCMAFTGKGIALDKLTVKFESWGWRDFFPYFGPFSVTPFQSVNKSSN